MNTPREIMKQGFTLVLTNVLLLNSIGCGEDAKDLEKSTDKSANNPPPETEEARYDIPENPGFSPNQPIGHCMVLAGYDKDSSQVFLSDPADNLKGGHKPRANLKGHPISFIKNYLTTVVNETAATVTGAIVVQPPDRRKGSTPTKWKQFGMPDFSQHAVSEWSCYCAPTSAANVLTFFSTRYPQLNPRQVFSSQAPREQSGDWFINRMISGSAPPLPKENSLAELMTTTAKDGTSTDDLRNGVSAYIRHSLGSSEKDWKVTQVLDDEDSPNGPELWDQLCEHCAAGDGILLCILWGIPVGGSGGSESPETPTSNASETQSESGAGNESDKGNESGEDTGNGSGRTSSQNPKHSPDGRGPPLPEGNFPEEPDPDRLLKPKEKIEDRPAVIVDDFNLEERNGLWYEKGKNRPFTGKGKRSYPSGSKLMEIPYLDGKRQGQQLIWRENGEVLRRVNWNNGKTSRQ
jgi:hypothetical protein